MKAAIEGDVRRPLSLWLKRIGAQMLWIQKVRSVGTISAYMAGDNARVFLVHDFADSGGWEIYIPSSNKNDAALSMDHAAEYLGVEGCRGLLE